MIVLPVVLLGGMFYLGSKRRTPKTLAERLSFGATKPPAALCQNHAEQNLALSSASFGLAAASLVSRSPVLGMASWPVLLYVFAPTFKQAWYKLSKERKINDQVLTATRVTVCMVMGYTLIAALDAMLLAYSQKLLHRNRQEFANELNSVGVSQPLLSNQFQLTLKQSVDKPGFIQKYGEHNGERLAPWMLAAFVLAIPVIGVNRSAAFLTTTFGAHLGKLEPYTNQHLSLEAIRQGIYITRLDALERILQFDTLILDGRLIYDAKPRYQVAQMLNGLRKQYPQTISVYVLVNTDEAYLGQALVDDLGLDGYFSVGDGQARADLLKRLQSEDKKTCYLGTGLDDAAAMQAAYLSIIQGDFVGIDTANADVVLVNNLSQLNQLFEVAEMMASKQQFNLLVPIGIDIIDISTTLILDFGLIYSVLFTYSGILLGMANTWNAPENKTSLPDLQSQVTANIKTQASINTDT